MKNNEDIERKDKIALFTLCSNNLVEVCLTMLYSFLYNNKWFYDVGEINVICDRKICSLSEKNRKKFSRLYENTIFREIDYDFYKPLITHQEKVLLSPRNLRPITYKYEIFKDYGYSKHVYFDADMIITADVRELFYNSFNFGACLDVSCNRYKTNLMFHMNSKNENAYVNTGMMIIGKELMNDEIFNKIFTFTLLLTPQYPFKKTLSWKGILTDQDVINEIIINYNIIPDNVYNHSHIVIDETNYQKTKIIHYCGSPKPWDKISEEYNIPHMIFYKYDYMRRHNFLQNDKENN